MKPPREGVQLGKRREDWAWMLQYKEVVEKRGGLQKGLLGEGSILATRGPAHLRDRGAAAELTN